MKIGHIAERTGMTAYTIRYYERIGLLPNPARDGSGQRNYDASILGWIEFLGRLKTTGMPIRDMLRYAKLRGRGAASEDARRDLLEQHRAKVRAHVDELVACLAVLDIKIAGYAAGSTKVEKDNDATPSQPPRKIRPRPARAVGH